MDYTQLKQIEFRRKFWKIVGADIFVVDPHSQQEVGFIHMQAWKLREDVRLFTDRTKQREIMRIHARQIIDISAAYDVIDSNTNQPVFAMKRKGLKSIFVRDHWELLDNNGGVFGDLIETSDTLAIIRRWIEVIPYVGPLIGLALAFVPQTYNILLRQADGTSKLAGTITRTSNPVLVRMILDTSTAQDHTHPFVPMAATSLLAVVEAAKN